MAGKGGGAWKVAYADFVTAMMAFFLVMWIVAQSEDKKEAIASHFSDPFARESEEDGTSHQKPPRHPAPARITDRPQHEKEAGGSHSVLLTTQGGQRTGIGIVVHFTDDSVELDAEAHRRLKEIVPLLIGKPQKIEVRGHSSRRPLPADSPFADHWRLSYERCLATMAELEKLGIPHERLRLSQAAGFEPLALPDEQLSGGGYARVEVALLNETTGAKLAQPAGKGKIRPKVTPVRHDSNKTEQAHGAAPHAAAHHAPAADRPSHTDNPNHATEEHAKPGNPSNHHDGGDHRTSDHKAESKPTPTASPGH